MKGPSTIRHFACLALATILALPVAAIPQYGHRVLPDLGFGGEVRGISSLGSQVAGCGYVYDSAGRIVSYEWDFDYNGNFLSGLGGPNSQANATTHSPGGLRRIVGYAENAGGTRKPVLWRETIGGSFSLTVLPTLGGAAGEATCRQENTLTFGQNVRSFMGARSTNSGGQIRAQMLCELVNGTIQSVDLGTLGGPNSYVNDLALRVTDENPVCVYVGAAQDAGGTWRACQWTVSENSFATGWDILIMAVGGAPGIASELSSISDNTSLFGSSRTLLGLSGNSDLGGSVNRSWIQVPPSTLLFTAFPEGYSGVFNRSASHNTQYTPSGLLTVGEAHLNSGPPVGTLSFGWDLDNDGLYDAQNTYLANELVPGNLPVAREMCDMAPQAIDEGLWWLAGSSWATFPSSYVPCLYQPTGRHMPDFLRRGGGAAMDERFLWFNDKRIVSNVATRSQPNLQPIEVHFYNLGDTATHEIGHWAGVMRAEGRNAAGTVTLKAYRPSTHLYETISTFQIGPSYQNYTFPVSVADYISADKRNACFILMFTPGNSSTTGYSLNSMQYTE